MGELTLANIEELLARQTIQINQNISDNLKLLQSNENRVKKLEQRCLYLERRLRRNNIVIFGLSIDGTDLSNQTLLKLNSLLDLNITIRDINNIHKIGKNSTPPIVVEFVSFLQKKEIFSNTEKLRALKGTGISISNDLCEEDRRKQKILRKYLKSAKEENRQARIVGDKLEIDKELFTISDLEDSDDDTETEGGGAVAVVVEPAKKKGEEGTKRKAKNASPILEAVKKRSRKKRKQ